MGTPNATGARDLTCEAAKPFVAASRPGNEAADGIDRVLDHQRSQSQPRDLSRSRVGVIRMCFEPGQSLGKRQAWRGPDEERGPFAHHIARVRYHLLVRRIADGTVLGQPSSDFLRLLERRERLDRSDRLAILSIETPLKRFGETMQEMDAVHHEPFDEVLGFDPSFSQGDQHIVWDFAPPSGGGPSRPLPELFNGRMFASRHDMLGREEFTGPSTKGIKNRRRP